MKAVLRQGYRPSTATPTRTGSGMFVQKRNEATGKLELVQVGTGNADGNAYEMDEGIRDLLSASSYLDMLNDVRRNRAYRVAIERALKPGDTVLDIGTGSGLLAMMAAKALGESDGKVIAFELFPPMAHLAKRIVKANLMEGKIQIEAKRSSDADSQDHDLADLVITEIFDSELLGEGLLPTMRHATKHLMKTGCRVIPYMAIIKCQFIQSDIIAKWKGGRGRGSFENFHECHINALFPNHVKTISDPFDAFTFLLGSPPVENGSMDIQERHSERSSSRLEGPLEAMLGTCHNEAIAIVELMPLMDNLISCYDEAGDIVIASIRHDETSIQVAVNLERNGNTGNTECSNATDIQSALHGSNQLWAFRDAASQKAYIDGMQCLFDALGRGFEGNLQVLCIAEGTNFLDIVTGAMPRGRITSVQETVLGMKLARKYAKFTQSQIQIDTMMHSEKVSPQLADAHWDFVVGEPFFWSRKNEVPWRHFLLFAQRCREIQAHGNSNFKVRPSGARIMCCLASMPEYRKSRRPLSAVEGFDLSLVSHSLGAARAGCPLELLPRSVWTCGPGYAEVSPRMALCQINMLNLEFSLRRITSIPISGDGSCDALVVWVDAILDDEENFVVSGAPNADGSPHHTMQGVALLPTPTTRGEVPDQVNVSLQFCQDSYDFIFALV